jgi:hypothetical protein
MQYLPQHAAIKTTLLAVLAVLQVRAAAIAAEATRFDLRFKLFELD